MPEQMPQSSAIQFFSDFYFGSHHFPAKIQEWGDGWCINHPGSIATFDFDSMTRLVFMAHDRCIRVGVEHGGPRALRICIWQRVREGSMSQRHPTLEQAIEVWRKYNLKNNLI